MTLSPSPDRLRWRLGAVAAVVVAVVMGSASAAAATTLEELYAGRLFFDESGHPLVTVRLMEAQTRVALESDQAVQVVVGTTTRTVAPNTPITVDRVRGTAAKVRSRVILETLEGKDRLAARRAALQQWSRRGVEVESLNVGGTYGVKGTVVDNRAVLIVAKVAPPAAKLAQWGIRPVDVVFLDALPAAVVRVSIGGVDVTPKSPVGIVRVIAPPDGAVTVLDVEHSVGFSGHGRQTRSYRGEVIVAPDQKGLLAAVNLIPESTLISGVVPSETFASAPLEALKAQAVTARGELFAKVGRKFFADPYVTCASQACQVYKGKNAETPRTNQAAKDTEGELLFFGGALVASVYSACCGGHTEPSDVVWGTPPQSALVGRADAPYADPASREWTQPAAQASLFAAAAGHPEIEIPVPLDLRREPDVKRFLDQDRALTFCGRSSFNQKGDHYRWTKRFTLEDLNARFSDLGVGTIKRLRVEGRGPGGRLRTLVVEGTGGSARVDRELPVRRRLGLKSGLFVIEEIRDSTGALKEMEFRGAGFGHGAGMCQQGAIGMAEAGYSYREILRHYYGGAEVRRVF